MGRKGLFSKTAKGSGHYAANGPGIYLEMDLEDYELGMWSEFKVGEETFINMGTLSCDSGFNVLARALRGNLNMKLG